MKIKATVAIIGLVLLVGLFLLLNVCQINDGPYEERYAEKLGFLNGWKYSASVEKALGKPIDVKYTVDRDSGEKFYSMTMFFDGYELYFEGDDNLRHKSKNYEDYSLACARITDPNYSIGKYNVSIGSDKNLVEKAYSGKRRLVDPGVFGFIDGTYWIRFCLDESNMVDKIVFTVGGP